MPPGRAIYRPGLLTDMYHPDSAYVSWRAGLNGLTTFELFARRAPFGGAYLLVAGLEAALDFVRAFRYSDDDWRSWTRSATTSPSSWTSCGGCASPARSSRCPEGSIAFPNEPLLRVTAPFREAILLESGLLQAINLATLIATKASRIVWAAQGRPVSEFALRRAQEPYVVSRSARIGGCWSTSFLAAAAEYRLLASGTIPHALVQLFEDERSAFEAVAETFNRYTLLLDTYDVRRAIHTAVDVARTLPREPRSRPGRRPAGQRRPARRQPLRARRAGRGRPAGVPHPRQRRPGRVQHRRPAGRRARRSTRSASGPASGSGPARSSTTSRAARWAASTRTWPTSTSSGVTRPEGEGGRRQDDLPGAKEVYRLGRYDEDVIQLADEPRPTAAASAC